mmetsp:Transcript_23885/g.70918  ORF Transcript_23885/g.70918 Transcript_23885/m.70918 type:complete len:99 (-) Transcript_23885:2233-2529(-)
MSYQWIINRFDHVATHCTSTETFMALPHNLACFKVMIVLHVGEAQTSLLQFRMYQRSVWCTHAGISCELSVHRCHIAFWCKDQAQKYCGGVQRSVDGL